jgi:hypothetical protein
MCPSLREQIINPKQSPFPDDAKAVCIYLTSPYKDNDAPIDTDASVKRLNDRGQLVQNKKDAQGITWQGIAKVEQKAPRPNGELHWSLWIEAHGAPMWFFGAEATLASERLGTRDFALWMQSCEAANNISFKYVVLDSCFSAAEQCPSNNRTVSPARAVSILLPGKKVLGYLGKNNSKTVAGLSVGGQATELGLKEGTALFQDGLCIEGPTTENLYFTPESLIYCKEALVQEFGITRSTAHVLGPVPGRDDEPKEVTKLPKKALQHLKSLNKIWTNYGKPSFFK